MSPRLALPLQQTPERMRVVQAFGANPEAYAQFGLQGHNGLDFEAEEGDLVVAVDDGEVVEVRFDGPGYGVTVKLLHAWGESRYAHGQRYSNGRGRQPASTDCHALGERQWSALTCYGPVPRPRLSAGEDRQRSPTRSLPSRRLRSRARATVGVPSGCTR